MPSKGVPGNEWSYSWVFSPWPNPSGTVILMKKISKGWSSLILDFSNTSLRESLGRFWVLSSPWHTGRNGAFAAAVLSSEMGPFRHSFWGYSPSSLWYKENQICPLVSWMTAMPLSQIQGWTFLIGFFLITMFLLHWIA